MSAAAAAAAAAAPGMGAPAPPPPALDRLRAPEAWAAGEIRALFPTHFAWSVRVFCAAGGRSRRVAASPLLGPDAAFAGTFGTIRRDLREAARNEARRRAEAAESVRVELPRELGAAWLRVARLGLARFLACAVCHVAAWQEARAGGAGSAGVGQADAGAWWAAGLGRLPRARFGPFVLTPLDASSVSAASAAAVMLRMVHGWLRVLLAAVAAAWLRVGADPPRALRSAPDVRTARGILEGIVSACAELLAQELCPRWAWPEAGDRVWPPTAGAAGQAAVRVMRIVFFSEPCLRTPSDDSLPPGRGAPRMVEVDWVSCAARGTHSGCPPGDRTPRRRRARRRLGTQCWGRPATRRRTSAFAWTRRSASPNGDGRQTPTPRSIPSGRRTSAPVPLAARAGGGPSPTRSRWTQSRHCLCAARCRPTLCAVGPGCRPSKERDRNFGRHPACGSSCRLGGRRRRGSLGRGQAVDRPK